MKLENTSQNGTLIVKPSSPRLDAAAAIPFRQQLDTLLNEQTTSLILDLSNVTFVDSSGLGCLINVLKKLGPRASLRLASVHENVMSLFELTRVDRVLSIHPDVDAALASIN